MDICLKKKGGVFPVFRYNDGMNAQQRYDKKRKHIVINVSIEQYAEYEQRATAHGMTVTQWIRQAIADREQWEDENA